MCLALKNQLCNSGTFSVRCHDHRLKTKVPKWLLSVLLVTAAVGGLSFSALAVCSLSSTSISFGNYDVFSTTPLDTNGSIVYRCGNADNNISISLDKGGAVSFNPRQMLRETRRSTITCIGRSPDGHLGRWHSWNANFFYQEPAEQPKCYGTTLWSGPNRTKCQ